MKAVLIAVVVALAWAGSVLAAPKTARELSGFVGLVREVVESRATIADDGGEAVEERPRLTRITKYDRRGNFVEWGDFKPSGALAERSVLEYATPGYIRTATTYTADGTVDVVTVGTYDAARRTADVIVNNGDGSIRHKATLTFDANGNNVQNVLTSPEGRAISRLVLSYNSKQQTIRWAWYKEGASAPSIEEFIYDGNGNLRRHRDLRSDGSVWLESRFIEYEFDTNGNWIKRKQMSEFYSRDGDKFLENKQVIYRKITYY